MRRCIVNVARPKSPKHEMIIDSKEKTLKSFSIVKIKTPRHQQGLKI